MDEKTPPPLPPPDRTGDVGVPGGVPEATRDESGPGVYLPDPKLINTFSDG